MHTAKYDLIVYICVCACGCTCVYMHTFACRIGQNVPKRSPVADNVPVEGQKPGLRDDQDYSTVDDVQQPMLAMSNNPAYKFVPEHSQQLIQGDDQAYSNVDIGQQEEVVTSGNPSYVTAARDK